MISWRLGSPALKNCISKTFPDFELVYNLRDAETKVFVSFSIDHYLTFNFNFDAEARRSFSSKNKTFNEPMVMASALYTYKVHSPYVEDPQQFQVQTIEDTEVKALLKTIRCVKFSYAVFWG